ncbi:MULTISPECIES: PPC domain-containing protein [Nostoc]|uniref:PPC domain-containing protein n=1 Tax=Nostoc paludosum FACHB-159 TaxID=2692908 RepID=A0ABR8K8C5_9NOSO|nr:MULTISPECIES: PPC domain-containing protein [Nostoc]MBD2678137.1 PPC domain-containing protein [Nostoc sp. FACHB-857]MBD2734397.1 PPC domain-containing protein [Nostoc paludosum FACHB-159]
MTNFNLGTLSSTPSHFSFETPNSTDVYQFQINSTRNVNLSLNEISAGDDSDLRLFRDVNGNGVFDANDRADGLVASSLNSSNFDDSINVRAGAGTYFAEVSRFSGSGTVTYDLDWSATTPNSTSDFSNLLPKEFELGKLSGDVTRIGYISDKNTADVYHFSLENFQGVNITLSGLSDDADIRLIRDFNHNGRVEVGEEIARSIKSGITSDIISNTDKTGEYFLQVDQFKGSTNYTLTFDQFTTSFA